VFPVFFINLYLPFLPLLLHLFLILPNLPIPIGQELLVESGLG
jgi:hypothetical protein